MFGSFSNENICSVLNKDELFPCGKKQHDKKMKKKKINNKNLEEKGPVLETI